MKINSEEYYNLLTHIKDNNPPFIAPLTPNSKIIPINLNTRIIEMPDSIIVEEDHLSNIIYFEMDRFFDNYDLANSIGIIQYINAEGEGYLYPIPFYDIFTKKDEHKIIFPWCIEGHATKSFGDVEFAIKFFEIKNKKIIYNINTQPAIATITKGLDKSPIENSNDYQYLLSIADELIAEIETIKRGQELYWIVLD